MSRPPLAQNFPAKWRGVELTISWDENWLRTGMAHLEIRCVAPASAILPITETGYRSHFIPPQEVSRRGGPVAYVIAWLDAAAASPEYQKREAASRQLKLF